VVSHDGVNIMVGGSIPSQSARVYHVSVPSAFQHSLWFRVVWPSQRAAHATRPLPLYGGIISPLAKYSWCIKVWYLFIYPSLHTGLPQHKWCGCEGIACMHAQTGCSSLTHSVMCIICISFHTWPEQGVITLDLFYMWFQSLDPNLAPLLNASMDVR